MRRIAWSASFTRAYRRLARRDPRLHAKVERTLRRLVEDPFHATLHTHKLKGNLAGSWACTVEYDNRIIFEFGSNPETGEEELLLITMGSHDEVY